MWTQTVSQVLEQAVASLTERKDVIHASSVMNHLRWNTYGSADISTVSQKSRLDADRLIAFLTQRRPALEKGFAADGAAVVYSGNGGSGNTIYDGKIYSVGDAAVALHNSTFSRAGYTFAGWNTKADGTGAPIGENESYFITENYMVLYAQWKEVQPPQDPSADPENDPGNGDETKLSFWQRFLAFFKRIIAFFRRLFNIGV